MLRVQLRRKLADVGQSICGPKHGQKLVKFGQVEPNSGRRWPSPGKQWPNSAMTVRVWPCVCQMWPQLGPNRRNLATRCWPKLAKVGQLLAHIGQFGSKLGRFSVPQDGFDNFGAETRTTSVLAGFDGSHLPVCLASFLGHSLNHPCNHRPLPTRALWRRGEARRARGEAGRVRGEV